MDYKSPLGDYYYQPKHPRSEYFNKRRPQSIHDRYLQQVRVFYKFKNKYGTPRAHLQPDFMDQVRLSWYPKNLQNLLKEDECKLCGCLFYPLTNAKRHYSGEFHKDNIRRYFEERRQRNRSMLQIDNAAALSSSFINALADYCGLCQVELFSMEDRLEHYSGKPHTTNEKYSFNAKEKKMSISALADYCELCQVTLSVQNKLNHYYQEAHKKKERSIVYAKKIIPISSTGEEVKLKDELQVHCDSNTHKVTNVKRGRRITRDLCTGVEKLGDRFTCHLCKVTVGGKDTAEHVLGKRHAKALRKFKCDNAVFDINVDNDESDKDNYQYTALECQIIEQKWVQPICHNMELDAAEVYTKRKTSRILSLIKLDPKDDDKQSSTNSEFTDHLSEPRHTSLTSLELGPKNTVDQFHCTVCDVAMVQVAKEEHMKDKKHLKQSLKKDTLNTLKTLANEKIDTTSLSCTRCDVTLNSFAEYSEHVLGDEHMDSMVSALYSKWGPAWCLNLFS